MAPIRFGTWAKNRPAQSLPIPGTKKLVLIDPTSGLVTETPVSNIGGGNPVVQTITFAASIAFNVVNGKWGRLILTGNVTAFSFSGLVAGDCGILRIFQDGTGGRTIAWPGTAVIASGGIALSAGASELTEIGYIYDGVTLTLQKEGYGAVAPDTTPPAIVSVTAIDGTTLRYIYDEPTTMTLAGHSWKKNGSAWTASSVAGSGTTWDVTMGSAAINTDSLLRSYDSATGATVDGSANELVSFTDSAVTNSIGGSYETESTAFFAVNTGLTTPQKDALDDLVIALKAIGWTKFKAVYPFIGGSAAAHKWNLINPVDTNGGFRITWNGTVTHDANGITGDGTTGYGETHLTLGTDISSPTTSSHMSLYSRTNSNPSNNYESDNASAGEMRWGILAKLSGDGYAFSGSTITSAVTTSQRLFVNTRTAHNVLKLFQDNTQVGATETTTQTGATPPTTSQTILAYKANGTVTQYSARNLSFFSMGDGLSDADVTALNTAVNTYQTALSRNV